MPNYTAFIADPPELTSRLDKNGGRYYDGSEGAVERVKRRLLALFHSGRGTRLLLVLFALLLVSVVFVGLNDVPGYTLAYLATAVLFVAVMRGWRSFKSYLALLLGSAAGIIFLSFLYIEVISRFALRFWGAGALDSLPMHVIESIFTCMILFAGPVGLVFGLFGTLGFGIRRLVRLRKRVGVTDRT